MTFTHTDLHSQCIYNYSYLDPVTQQGPKWSQQQQKKAIGRYPLCSYPAIFSRELFCLSSLASFEEYPKDFSAWSASFNSNDSLKRLIPHLVLH